MRLDRADKGVVTWIYTIIIIIIIIMQLNLMLNSGLLNTHWSPRMRIALSNAQFQPPLLSIVVLKDGSLREEKYGYGESLRKRTEVPAVVSKEGIVIVAAEPPLQAVRKRHHTLTQEDHIITPLPRMPPLPPVPTQNVTIFQMLQQLDEFEC
ncbi:uncharacterized protein LOC110643364 isoform X2 [Hevea brasiliensis]|uniref:uncharacterized protein LOC110643364 isoform X2 n=1 Tax=Hevea brasiliensis TaxID=3981 RepID=UPI0025F5E2CF|nr:uncharacterized protein LOC110643364 isoform X2 [Hevea brasiliensis]XP_057997149.1 uncharacterized protein LOC110643364 isoform X2 [Hevea brasiliensis]